jgi:hypothetical protein
MKGKEVVRDGENADEDELHEKPVRRGRSSGGREELLGAAGSSKITGKSGRGKEKSTQEARDAQSAPKKRGRPAAVQVEEPAEVAELSKQSQPQRRGRSSNTEGEVRAVAELAAQVQDTPKKRGRRPAAEKEVKTAVEEADEDPIAPPKRRRRTKAVEAEPPVDELTDDNSARQKKKKRRSGAEILEAGALALTATEDHARGRTRLPLVDQEEVVSAKDGQARGRKRLRRSDAQIAELQPSPVDREVRGGPRTRRSDADLSEEAMAGRSKQSKRSRQRDQRNEVEAASSKVLSNSSGPKKGVKAAIEKRIKSGGGSAAAEQSQRSKKRISSSIPGGAEKVVLRPSLTWKQSSKRQAQEEPESRKSKEVESKQPSHFPEIALC